MKNFRERKYGFVALAFSALEAIVIWGSLGILYFVGRWGYGPHWLEVFLGSLYLAGLAAPVLALVGLFKDSQRGYAALGLVLGTVNIILCGVMFKA